MQKVLDDAWQADVDRIYSGYTIYYQSGGVEQPVFDATGSAAPRSARLLDRLADSGLISAAGRLLDVGCGNGALLQSAAKVMPNWSLAGTELNDKYRAIVEEIPRVEALYVGSPVDVPGRFDLITMLHVLEHLPFPMTMMAELRTKLTPGGMVVVQIPEFVQNPFDLLIADHCTHFMADTLSAFLTRAGYDVVGAHQGWIPKELTVLARAADRAPAPAPSRRTYSVEPARSSVAWLTAVLDLATRASGSVPFGIFGTSIAATWLAGELSERVSFFVDEDPSRIGREHLGKPIYRPDQQPSNAHILMALPGALGDHVAERLRTLRPDVTVYTLAALA